MPEFRHGRSGSLNIPSGNARPANGSSNAGSRFEGPRSPPNTSHVPCKFFRQGACQAGKACPFSHDLGSASDTICKYFAKGNCKFGPKCANIHVLPDGRRINYGKNGVTVGTSPISLGSRPGASPTLPSTETYHANSASALTNSLYGTDNSQYAPPAFPFDDQQPLHLGHHSSLENGMPGLDAPYSRPTSNYGSPRDDDHIRSGFGLSPVNGRGLSVLDAPLPASFDSNGISNAARFPAAPWPSSVPSKFGLDSPTPSLSNAKESRTSETLKLLHTSAFGSSDHLVSTIAGSPHSQTANGEEYFGKRAMHSSRYAKPRMLSASLPKSASIDRDWDNEFAFGDDAGDNLPENYLPENLQDLLTPAEKARRGSIRADGDSSLDGLSKYGSPIGSSPSRWGPLFQRQKEEEEAASRANRGASAFGHVGSPLRTSTLAKEMGDSLTASTGLNRPTSGRTNSESMSMLSQQLQRHRIDEEPEASSPHLHPSSARTHTNTIAPIEKHRGMERHISSGSISSTVTGRFTTPIDEEDPDFVFSMEEEDETINGRSRKRVSAGLSIGAWGSYAGVVSGKPTSNGSKDSVPLHGRG
ncbi:hypothetical protein NLU13_6692 [Sarocladium strictum]|uniref:C3H1-type domain-containing protein n=1 Tax=Sarocladium strictum TaxID=5046 RepID=A0AA39GG73_SARSR|nr:hypothetical protein NLU13_6692 [Sarocladium strictum]